MNENLQRRIQNLMGNESMPMQMQMGGEVEQPMPEMMPPQADNSMLESAINELMMARDTAEDPFEAEKAQQLAEATALSAEAPLATIAQEVMSAGRGDDTTLAHLQPGEVVLPPEMFDDPQFEMAVESRFNELDLDPERYVVGMGIASLNPSTGLEEFGFFKKVGKFFKKVVKKVAPIAAFIPGVGTALGGVLGGLGSIATNIPGIGKALGRIGSTVAKGIGSLNIPGISTIARGTEGGFSGIADALTTPEELFGEGPLAEIFGVGTGTSTEPGTGTGTSTSPGAEEQAQQQNILQRIINAKLMGDQGPNVGALGLAGLLGKLAYDEAKNRKGVPLTPMTQLDSMGRFNIQAEINRQMGLEAPNPVEFGLMPANTIPQLSGGRPEEPVGMQAGGSVSSVPEGMKEFFLTTHISDMTVGQQDMLRDLINNDPVFAEAYYQSDDLRMPEAFDVVTNVPEGMFGGVSHEEFAKLMGLTPTQKSKRSKGVGGLMKNRIRDKGRRTAERMLKLREIARRTGKMMRPEGAMGGYMSDIEMDRFLKGLPDQMYMGGPVMAYADGGNVSDEDFKRKTGKINGPGTETSDDIPAMLSDGEFVFKSQSVRGAGAFDMNKKRGGIIELVPNNEESRERGTDLMYEMMDLFSSYAKKRA